MSVGLHWLSVHARVFISVQVNLEDLYNGKTSKLAVHRNVVCSTCNGIGGKEVRESVRGIQCMLTSRHHAKYMYMYVHVEHGRAYDDSRTQDKVQSKLTNV